MKHLSLTICTLLCIMLSPISAQQPLSWKKLGDLHTARTRFALHAISENKAIVIGGTQSNGIATSLCELIDIVTGQVQPAASMSQARSEFPSLVGNDSCIYVFGGFTGDSVTGQVECFNPRTNVWSVVGNMVAARRQHIAAWIDQDNVIIIGGRNSMTETLNTTEIMNIRTGQSRRVRDYPTLINNGIAQLNSNGALIVFGGRMGGDDSEQTTDIMQYNNINDEWNKIGSIPVATELPACIKLWNEQLLYTGGNNEATGNTWLNDIVIEKNKSFSIVGKMQEPRHEHWTVQLDENRIITGTGRKSNNTGVSASTDIFTLNNSKVAIGPSLRTARYGAVALSMPIKKNGSVIYPRVIVVSGVSNEFTKSIEILDDRQAIEGIINIYTPVTGIGTDCNATITVADNKGFSVGDKVLIIQMQGAEIVPDNTEQYGKVIDYRSTGNHEFSRIVSITNRIIGLESQLLHSYDITKKVQMIRVPEYQSIIVSNTLTAKEWDGSTGGVLVFDVQDTLELYAGLNVTGKGFRGGRAISTTQFPKSYIDDYIVDVQSPCYAAAKGEGIAGYGIARMTNGRGSAANGGGGGGNHNAGGGGGANYGAGGTGGYGWFSLAYSGNNEDAQGLGGKPIDYISFTSGYTPLMMGGGGGAGHTNQTTVGHGGAGGGIIVVKAETIVPNSNSFIADGAPGNDGVEDGAGGGGGGGAIYIDAKTIASKLACSASGGKGGDIRLEKYATPPGGGGGSGLVTFTNRVPSSMIEANIKAGIAGISVYQSDNYGAKDGQAGIVTSVETIHESLPSQGGGGRQATLPNSYYKVNSIFPDLGGVQLSSYNGLCPDDKVLIIQMQGAFINTDNTADYGKIQSLVFSGNYEFARIASITSIGIIFKNKLKNFYSPTDGSVQLIRVPEYRDLTINSPLSCQAWNGETGGVLVFSVENTLQLNSFIDVTGKGFRGGAASNAVKNPTMHTGDYVSAVDSTRFSRKGEGIFGWRNPDHRAGRGAAASGGGGGNNHNAGGGGGSYLGCGGMGGYGWDTYPGDRTITQGMGGYPIQLIGNKIFLGGGGGAGHSNEFTGTAGAAGGGIIIIQAKEIISNNQSIIAKGADGKNAPFDGTGGGGAGGTILLDCRRFVNRIELDVRGGSGGSTTEHRDGPGGGGGGGLIGFTAPETPTDVIPLVNGGGSGTNRDLNKDGATNGCPGAVLHNIALPGDIIIIATMDESQADDSKSALPYPHPASETVHLSVITNEPITLCDVLGNVLDIPITQHSQGISIDVSMIHAGNYYIRVGNTYYSCVVIH